MIETNKVKCGRCGSTYYQLERPGCPVCKYYADKEEFLDAEQKETETKTQSKVEVTQAIINTLDIDKAKKYIMVFEGIDEQAVNRTTEVLKERGFDNVVVMNTMPEVIEKK